MSENEDTISLNNQTIFLSSSENMVQLQDESIDVIVTSPPYNRNKTYSSDNQELYNDKLPESEYLEFLSRVWSECYRVAKKHAVFFLNIGDSAEDQGISEKVVNSAASVGWKRIQDIIWVKSIYGRGHYTPTGGNKRFNNVWEHIYMLVKNESEYSIDPKAIGIPYADKSNIGRYGDSDLRDPGNIFHITYEKTTGATVKKGHDAPFPIGLPYMCIKAVPYCETVLDPFLGTGTTLAACNCLNKTGYGYEKYPRLELIKTTIEQGLGYNPQETILIPHYETSIRMLISIIESAKKTGKPLEITSKAEYINFQILTDTLKKMNISVELLDLLNVSVNFSQNVMKFIDSAPKFKTLHKFVRKDNN
jgi:site-specific DNA-methyltransferase (adenine-specific)